MCEAVWRHPLACLPLEGIIADGIRRPHAFLYVAGLDPIALPIVLYGLAAVPAPVESEPRSAETKQSAILLVPSISAARVAGLAEQAGDGDRLDEREQFFGRKRFEQVGE